MIASSVTLQLKEEEAEVEGIKGARESIVSIRGPFGQSWATLRRTDAVLMAPMTIKR